MASIRLPCFSYNYSKWPFVEIGDDFEQEQLSKIDNDLRLALSSWALYMQLHFDDGLGFDSTQSRESALREYRLLCNRLLEAGVKFRTDLWWL
jgi:hypothetical protein